MQREQSSSVTDVLEAVKLHRCWPTSSNTGGRMLDVMMADCRHGKRQAAPYREMMYYCQQPHNVRQASINKSSSPG